MNNINKITKEFFLAFLLIIIGAYQILPVILNLKTFFFFAGDDALITWILNQTIQKIPDNLSNIFETNIFYPYENTLAYSVTLIPSAVLSYFSVKLTQSHVAAYNFTLIFAQISTILVLFFLLKDITKDSLASFVATVVFALSFIRMSFFIHLHTFINQWWLASVWMIYRFKESKKVIYFYLSFLFLIIQTWESIYQIPWILLFALVFLYRKKGLLLKNIKHILVNFMLVFLFTYPVLSTYYFVSKELGINYTIRDHAHFSLSFDDLWKKYFSPIFYFLFLVSIIWFLENKNMIKKYKEIFFTLIVGFFISLGPVLKWSGQTVKLGEFFMPLPYTLLYYLIPGISALRNVHRFILISVISSTILIAIYLTSLKGIKRLLVFTTILCLSLIFGKTVKSYEKFSLPKKYPYVYQWLKKQPGEVIYEYPTYFWYDKNHSAEMYRMLYSLYHKKNLISGASAAFPKERLLLLTDLSKNFPNNKLINKLKLLGVDYLIVHKNQLDKKSVEKIWASDFLRPLYNDEHSVVFSLK